MPPPRQPLAPVTPSGGRPREEERTVLEEAFLQAGIAEEDENQWEELTRRADASSPVDEPVNLRDSQEIDENFILGSSEPAAILSASVDEIVGELPEPQKRRTQKRFPSFDTTEKSPPSAAAQEALAESSVVASRPVAPLKPLPSAGRSRAASLPPPLPGRPPAKPSTPPRLQGSGVPDAARKAELRNEPRNAQPVSSPPRNASPTSQKATAQLRVIAGVDKGAQFALTGAKITIGRSLECDIVLKDIAVSRKHVRLLFDGEAWALQDLSSGNGTLVNDEFRESSCLLRDGDRLEIGKSTLVLDHAYTRARYDEKLSMSVSDLPIPARVVALPPTPPKLPPLPKQASAQSLREDSGMFRVPQRIPDLDLAPAAPLITPAASAARSAATPSVTRDKRPQPPRAKRRSDRRLWLLVAATIAALLIAFIAIKLWPSKRKAATQPGSASAVTPNPANTQPADSHGPTPSALGSNPSTEPATKLKPPDSIAEPKTSPTSTPPANEDRAKDLALLGGPATPRAVADLYEARKFDEASRAAADSARLASGSQAKELRALSGRYAELGEAFTRGQSTLSSDPSSALTAFLRAAELDARCGSAHKALLTLRIATAAPQAAARALTQNRYEAAAQAVRAADAHGAGDHTSILGAKRTLSRVASEWLATAQELRRSNPDRARELAARVQKIVAKSDSSYAAAEQLLR